MADENTLERTYNVPLRKEFLKVPKYKRSKKAIKALKQFLSKHMKSDNVKIGKYLNDEIWKHGIKNPPHHVKVDVVKDKDDLVTAELVGAPVVEKEEEETKGEKKEEKVSPKTEEPKIEEKSKIEEKPKETQADKKSLQDSSSQNKAEKSVKKEKLKN